MPGDREMQEWLERTMRLHPTAEVRVTRTDEIPEPAGRLLRLLFPWEALPELGRELVRCEPAFDRFLPLLERAQGPDPSLASDIEGFYREWPVQDLEAVDLIERICAILRNENGNSRQGVEIQERALGRYYPDGTIVIYERVIERVADAIGVDPGTLKTVVLAHEMAHAITHLGIDADGGHWSDFPKAQKELKEAHAQYWAKAALADMDRGALHAFWGLEKHQSEVYRLWREYDCHSREEVRATLLACRRHGVGATWDFSRGVLSTLSALR